MNELLARVFEAHGGLERRNEFDEVSATIVAGGVLEITARQAGPAVATMRSTPRAWSRHTDGDRG